MRSRTRLFCFPYAGGGASIFHSWRAPVGGGFELWPVQFPGRENRIREAPIDALDPLIDALEQALACHLVPPFAFFGHSLGGLISFELARRLRQKQMVAPIHLFISGRSAPHILETDEPMHRLDDAAFLLRLRKLNGTPKDVLESSELMSLTLPMLKADIAASETYVHDPQAPLECPISVFGGFGDAEVHQRDLDEWRLHTRGRFRLRMCPGDHFFLHANRNFLLSAIAEDLQMQ